MRSSMAGSAVVKRYDQMRFMLDLLMPPPSSDTLITMSSLPAAIRAG